MNLISFDIDGTMVFGDPPGHITVAMVRKAQELGVLVGSASDRTIRDQTEVWSDAGIQLNFVVLKHRLADVRGQFTAGRYLHIGDTDVDRWFASQAGFDFLRVQELPNDGSDDWLLDYAGLLL